MLDLLDRVSVIVEMNDTDVFSAISKNVSVLVTASELNVYTYLHVKF